MKKAGKANKSKSVDVTVKKKKGANSGGTNYLLEQSPLSDGKTSYMRRQGTVAPKEEYSNARKGKMTLKDFNKANEVGEKAKQKYIEKKRKITKK
ncbi:MAG: hypothetical protein NC350_05100 [Corallococcus sp.]|nr:hypothetical protein [Corallococcus sp.]